MAHVGDVNHIAVSWINLYGIEHGEARLSFQPLQLFPTYALIPPGGIAGCTVHAQPNQDRSRLVKNLYQKPALPPNLAQIRAHVTRPVFTIHQCEDDWKFGVFALKLTARFAVENRVTDRRIHNI